MSFDYAETVKTLLDNEQALVIQRVSPQDLKTLRKSLALAKDQIRLQIVSDMIRGDKSLPEQIGATKRSLQARITILQAQEQELQSKLTYPVEFSEPSIPNDMPPALKDAIITQHKQDYDRDKQKWEMKNGIDEIQDRISKIQAKIAELEGYVSKLDDPQAFIQAFLKDAENNLLTSEKYRNVLKICAAAMDPTCASYPSGAQNYSGLTTEEKQNNGPLFFWDSGKNTFTINPTSLSAFIDRVRDPKLVTELDNYANLQRDENCRQSEYARVQKQVQDAQALKDSLGNKEICAELEEFISQLKGNMLEYNRAQHTMKQNKKTTELIKAPKNPVVRFFNNIFGKARIAAAEEKCKQENAALSLESEKHSTATLELLSKHSQRLAESPQYKMAFDAYVKAAPQVNINPRDRWENNGQWKIFTEQSISNSTISNNQLVAVASLVLLSGQAGNRIGIDEPITMNELVLQTLKPEQVLSQAQARENDAKNSCELAEQARVDAEQKLSTTAKQLIAQGIDVKGLKNGYVDREGMFPVGSQRNTPYFASLAAQALLEAGNIRTIEEAQQLGIEITPEEINKFNQDGLVSISNNLANLVNTHKELEELNK